MSAGASYPAEITDPDGKVIWGGFIKFTDASDQPAGASQPFVAPADSGVTVAEYSDAAIAIFIDDEVTERGIALHSKDGNSVVTIANGGIVVEGPWLFDASLVQVDSVAGQNVAAALVPFARITSKYTITAGALPKLASWVSTTPQQNAAGRQVTVNVEVAFDGTNNVASCAIAISPDNVTYSTIGTPSLAAAVNFVGATTQLVPVTVPDNWFIKLTLVHATVADSTYY